jgi:hypothetical protein
MAKLLSPRLAHAEGAAKKGIATWPHTAGADGVRQRAVKPGLDVEHVERLNALREGDGVTV